MLTLLNLIYRCCIRDSHIIASQLTHGLKGLFITQYNYSLQTHCSSSYVSGCQHRQQLGVGHGINQYSYI
jgi:hypothetical protein